jgi:hypothetical protein
MTKPTRHKSALGPLTIATGLALLCAAPALAGTASPLPRSDYTVRAACAAPAAGHAGCLAMQLVPLTAEARAHMHPLGITRSAQPQAPSPSAGDFGLRPQDLHSAYQLPSSASNAQKVALVDAYNDPTAETDLKAYDEEFGLPACTTANGCFSKVNQNGETANLPFPKTTAELETARKGSSAAREEAEEATGWALEISLDIEVTRATCHNCDILLVEANSSSLGDLETGERTAEARGAGEISNSWGGAQQAETPARESASAFNDPGIVITASAGDDGYLNWDSSSEKGYTEFPSSSPHVVAVGGTRLSVGAKDEWTGETVWNGDGAGGGGCSTSFTAQPWQQGTSDWSAVGCGEKRAVADVSADADPYTGLAVHDTSPECEYEYKEGKTKHVAYWCTIGGTSLASPMIASVFALAGGANAVAYPAKTLYENEVQSPASLHDVALGSNGACSKPFNLETGLSGCTPGEEAATSCASKAICLSRTGYDGPSGVGTPDGLAAFEPPGGGEHGGSEEKGTGGEEHGGSEEKGTGDEEQHGGSEEEHAAPEEGAGAEETGNGSGSPKGAPVGGASPTQGQSGASLVAAAASSASGDSTATAASTGGGPIRLFALALTPKARAALNDRRPHISQIVFAFTLNVSALIHVAFAQRAQVDGHMRWRSLRHSLTTAAVGGRNRRSLHGGSVLSRGLYRLTLTPTLGAARSISFTVG